MWAITLSILYPNIARRSALAHDRPISALNTAPIADIGRNAREDDGVLKALVPPRLQAAQHEEAYFIMHMSAEAAQLWTQGGKLERQRGEITRCQTGVWEYQPLE
jgi:hypothetical protein